MPDFDNTARRGNRGGTLFVNHRSHAFREWTEAVLQMVRRMNFVNQRRFVRQPFLFLAVTAVSREIGPRYPHVSHVSCWSRVFPIKLRRRRPLCHVSPHTGHVHRGALVRAHGPPRLRGGLPLRRAVMHDG